MWKPKLKTVCCLVLFCATSGTLKGVNSAAYPLKNLRHEDHKVIFDALSDQDLTFYEENRIPQKHVKGRSSVQSTYNHHQPDDIFQSLHRSSDEIRTRGLSMMNRNVGGGASSSETQRKIEEFMESFYLKQLRIEMQKSQILHSFPPDELPTAILEQRDSVSSEDSAAVSNANTLHEMHDVGDDENDDEEMLNFVRQVGSSIEQKDFEQENNNELDSEPEESADLGWLANLRPMYRFIRDHMERFRKELREHKRKMERVWKQVQEERNAIEREDGDEPYDVSDFERETEKREIIFLDEVDCDHVFNGYYPSSPPTIKEYLDFCLQIDRNKFKPMVESARNHSETNSVSELPQLQIQKAELWFYKSNADAMDSHKQMFSLKSIDNWDIEGKYKKFETISLKQSPTAVGWISADVSAPLVEWLSPMAFATLHKTNHRRNTAYHKKRNLDAYFAWKKNFGHTSKHKFFLNVSCKTCIGGDPVENRTQAKPHQPFFLIDYKRIDPPKHDKRVKHDPMAESRNRRDRRNLNCSETTKDCCRERLWIEFKENGMDFIINPKGYWANFCRGDCNTAADNAVRSAHNTLVRNYAQSDMRRARRLGIKTCCSATEYESLNVMYLNQNNMPSNMTFKNLIVKSCGCN